MAACYLGEALIADVGGRWVQDLEHGLGVELTPNLVAFPFAKVANYFANENEDSVLSFFDTTALLAADQRRRSSGSGGASSPDLSGPVR